MSDIQHYRTLKFGDRTISYDAGLDSLQQQQQQQQRQRRDSSIQQQSADGEVTPTTATPPGTKISDQADDDGIGSSDDETIGSNASSGDHGGHEGASADAAGDEETGGFECDSSPNLADNRRKVIRPDKSALDQLLAFDEEEEDDLEEEEEEDVSDDDDDARKPGGGGGGGRKSGWQKTIVKDLANLSSSSNGSRLQRRHSITVCQSCNKRKKRKDNSAGRKTSTDSNASSDGSTTSSSSSGEAAAAAYSLNVTQMHATLQTELESLSATAASSSSWAMPPSSDLSSELKTLSLGLDEVAHIRSVLTRAELEALPIDGNVRESVEKGKVCFLCMKTKFGLFSRGHRCEMCKQQVCHRCHSRMKIPVEHFNNTPVYALSPSSPSQAAASSQMPSASPELPPHCKDKKLSLPDTLGLSKSAGSAPNSPTTAKRAPMRSLSSTPKEEEVDEVPTISGGIGGFGPVSLPASRVAQYATLPKNKNRRLSLMTAKERERLEGSLLTVCADCKDMVLQVIRTSRTSRRMHMVRSMFLNNSSSLTPSFEQNI